MKTRRLTTTLVAAMFAVSLAGSGSAWAERKHDQHGYSHSQSQSGHYDKRSKHRERGALHDRRSHKRDHIARSDRRSHKRDHIARHDRRSHKRDHIARHDRRSHKRDHIARLDRRSHRRDHIARLDRRSHKRDHIARYDRRAYGHNGYYDKPYYKKHHKKHKRHHYKGSHKYYKHHGYRSNNYYYDDDDSDENLLFGLLVGGLIGYAINSAQDSGDSYDSYPPSNTQHQPQALVYEADAKASDTCLQAREYQTKVIVGGRPVDAYGTACLQPDGSWTRGPAKLATY